MLRLVFKKVLALVRKLGGGGDEVFHCFIQMHKRAYFGILNDSKMTALEGGRGSLDSKPFSQRSVLPKKIFLFGRSYDQKNII